MPFEFGLHSFINLPMRPFHNLDDENTKLWLANSGLIKEIESIKFVVRTLEWNISETGMGF